MRIQSTLFESQTQLADRHNLGLGWCSDAVRDSGRRIGDVPIGARRSWLQQIGLFVCLMSGQPRRQRGARLLGWTSLGLSGRDEIEQIMVEQLILRY